MKRSWSFLVPCAVAVMSAGLLSAASISLDTVGADPDLTSPFFSFTTDQAGSYSAVYTNVSNPPFNFISLQLTAPFSPEFYNGRSGPRVVLPACSGGSAFNTCAITFLDDVTTLVFRFSGLDATHFGFPYLGQIGISATLFEPNQTLSAVAVVSPVGTPEPGAFQLAAIGLVLCGLVVGRNKFLKSRVRS